MLSLKTGGPWPENSGAAVRATTRDAPPPPAGGRAVAIPEPVPLNRLGWAPQIAHKCQALNPSMAGLAAGVAKA